jgi:hypothetical protein
MNANYDVIAGSAWAFNFRFNQVELLSGSHLKSFLSSIGITVNFLPNNQMGVKELFECFDMSQQEIIVFV